jgi:hypothetical protein
MVYVTYWWRISCVVPGLSATSAPWIQTAINTRRGMAMWLVFIVETQSPLHTVGCPGNTAYNAMSLLQHAVHSSWSPCKGQVDPKCMWGAATETSNRAHKNVHSRSYKIGNEDSNCIQEPRIHFPLTAEATVHTGKRTRVGVGVLLAADSQSTSASGYRASLWDPWPDISLLFFRWTITLFCFQCVLSDERTGL